MRTHESDHVFNRSGLAALSDMECLEYQRILTHLTSEQEAFLSKEHTFRSEGYIWPRDALRSWSRMWEYPYVYYHLDKERAKLDSQTSATVVDLGSGVTFFPFAAAKLGYRLLCLDIDPICEDNLHRATEVVPHPPGRIDFRLISSQRLPLGDAEADVVYCISVLEHIPDFENTIDEVARVLKPGGLFVLTIDLDLCGYLPIGVKPYSAMRSHLAKCFDTEAPEVTTHPADILQCRNGPVKYGTYSNFQIWNFRMRQWAKTLLRRQSIRTLPNLAVWGGVMRKRGGARGGNSGGAAPSLWRA